MAQNAAFVQRERGESFPRGPSSFRPLRTDARWDALRPEKSEGERKRRKPVESTKINWKNAERMGEIISPIPGVTG
jgi:hypothetical protein